MHKTNTFAVHCRTMTVSKKHIVQLSYKGNVYFMELHFYLQDMLLKLGYLAGIFTQTYRKSLSVSIQLIVFVPSIKSRAFKQKLEFLKMCILHSELDSLPIHEAFFFFSGGL